MLKLNTSELIQDTLVTFNYHYEPYQQITPAEINETAINIVGKMEYFNCYSIENLLKELIQVMISKKYNVLKHYDEFKPIHLVRLLYLLGLDIKRYYIAS